MRTLPSLVVAFLSVVVAAPASAYSVLTHEAVIDTVWEDSLAPAILARYPNATPEELRKAHAFAYGGVIVQDMGYYPFGTEFFSDLTHYVRSGDFIEALLAEARTLEEYAFALGSIAHYAGDTNGHSHATNPSVALIYPKLRKKYGDEITYAEDRTSHIRTEFGFDVLQAARGRYKSEAYHDFIGFEVSEDQLERAFVKTYGLTLGDVLDPRDLAIESYRYSVSTLVPNATEMAWQIKKDELIKENPGLVREKFVYSMTRDEYEKKWGTSYIRPSFGTKLLGAIVGIMPKVGPFKAHGFEPPTPEAEKLYLESFDDTVAMYRDLIRDAQAGRLELDDRNFDTGDPIRIGEYVLADQAYEQWLESLIEDDFKRLTPEIRDRIRAFYAEEPGQPSGQMTKSDVKESRESIRDARKLLPKLEAAKIPAGGAVAGDVAKAAPATNR